MERKCKVCGVSKELNVENFRKAKGKGNVIDGWFIQICKECEKQKRKSPEVKNREHKTVREWYCKNLEKNMLKRAYHRAKNLNLPFNLEISDIIIPKFCPILEIEIKPNFKNGFDSSPSLDRIDPNLGYIKGNVRVISRMANIMKAHATKEQLETFIKNIKVYLAIP